jgi:alpha-D-ribose 1-methylphosphonate 5-triphosphate diphosphatase PhnM
VIIKLNFVKIVVMCYTHKKIEYINIRKMIKKSYLTDKLANNLNLVDELNFIISLNEETQSQRNFKNGYIEYIQEKYSLTDRELLKCYKLVTFNYINKYTNKNGLE